MEPQCLTLSATVWCELISLSWLLHKSLEGKGCCISHRCGVQGYRWGPPAARSAKRQGTHPRAVSPRGAALSSLPSRADFEPSLWRRTRSLALDSEWLPAFLLGDWCSQHAPFRQGRVWKETALISSTSKTRGFLYHPTSKSYQSVSN